MRDRGFTLIELLVVISIISLLSSTVFASLSSARRKAAISAALQFSANLYHAAGDEAVGIWTMDECSGTTANDTSGLSSNGTLVGGAAFSSDTPSGKGCSVSMTGNGQYIDAGSAAGLSNFSTRLSVMGWMKVTTNSCYNWIFSNDRDVAGPYNGYGLGAYCGSQPIFSIWNGTRTFVAGPTLEMNRWYHLAGIYDGSSMKLYIDGKEVASTPYSGGIGTPASFGNIIGNLGACPGCTPHGMLVDSVYVFAKAMVASEVEAVYAAERRTDQFAAK